MRPGHGKAWVETPGHPRAAGRQGGQDRGGAGGASATDRVTWWILHRLIGTGQQNRSAAGDGQN